MADSSEADMRGPDDMDINRPGAAARQAAETDADVADLTTTEAGRAWARIRKPASVAFKVLVLAAVAWYVRGTIVEGFEELGKAKFTLRWGWLVLSGAVYLLANIPCGWFWWYAMRRLGQETTLYRALRAYVIGHLGKYVPGKALVVILRSAFVRGPGVDGGVAAASVFLETLTLMASGASLAAVVLLVSFREHLWLTGISLAAAAVTFGPTLPPVFRFVLKRMGIGKRDPEIDRKLAGLSLGVVAVGWLATGFTWVLYGVSLWAALSAISETGYPLDETICPLTAISALSVVLGFLSMIPGGFGVRDLVLVELLQPFLESVRTANVEAAALAAAMLLRLVWLGAELAAAGVLYALRPRRDAE